MIETLRDIRHNRGMEESTNGPETGVLDMEQLPLPRYLNDWELVEKGKKGNTKFSERGRQAIDGVWNSVYESVGGDEAELSDIEASVVSAVEKLNEWAQEKDHREGFTGLARLSIEKRLEAREMAEHKSEIEEASNSPWQNVLVSVRKNYPNRSPKFVDNFAIRAIAKKREEVKTAVSTSDLDEQQKEHLATHYDHLVAADLAINLDTEDASAVIKEKGLSAYFAENYDTEKIQDLIEAQKETALAMLSAQNEIVSQDIPESNPDPQSLGSRFKGKWLQFAQNHPRVLGAAQAGGATLLGMLIIKGDQPEKGINQATMEALANQAVPTQETNEVSELRNEAEPRERMAAIVNSESSEEPKEPAVVPAETATHTETSSTAGVETPTPPSPSGTVQPAESGALVASEDGRTQGQATGQEVFEQGAEAEKENEEVNQFMLGEIDLTKDFTLVVPEEWRNLEGVNENGEYNLSVRPVLENDTDENLINAVNSFNDWRNHPSSSLTWRTNIPNNNIVEAHTGIVDGNAFPAEFLEQAYQEYGEDIVGKRFTIKDESGNTQEVGIVNAQVIDGSRFVQDGEENHYPYGVDINGDDPMFYRLDVIGFDDAAMQEGITNFIGCTGTYLQGAGFEDRIIVSVKPVEENKSKKRPILPWRGGYN